MILDTLYTYIPVEYLPAVGEPDPFIKIPRPDMVSGKKSMRSMIPLQIWERLCFGPCNNHCRPNLSKKYSKSEKCQKSEHAGVLTTRPKIER